MTPAPRTSRRQPASRRRSGPLSMFERELSAVRGSGIPTRLEVETGRPSKVLRELSEHVDLLLIGSGGRRRAGVGSTGRALLHEAFCPIVIVPAPGA